MSRTEKFDAFPLNEWGDKIVKALNELGITAGISIIINDLDNGAVTSTTNLPDEDDFALISFVLNQRLLGKYTYEDTEMPGEPN